MCKNRLRRAPTLGEASEIFLKEHGAKLKPSTLHDYRALLRHHIVPALGALPIADCRSGAKAHRALSQRGLLLLPDSKTGQEAIFLNEPAVDLLRALPKTPDNPHVIVGAKQGGHLR